MSAVNIIVQRSAAHIITDGAKYLASGELVGIGSKCAALPHLPALMSLRGPNVLGFVAETIGLKFASFDAFVDGVEVALEEFVDENEYLWEDSGQTLIELMFVGWSEVHRKFGAYAIRTAEANDKHTEAPDGGANVIHTKPYQLTELPSGVMAPVVSEDALKSVGLSVSSHEQFDPIVDGRRLLEAQRALKVSLFDGDPPTYHCGGLAMLSTVTRDGTVQKVFHRWPDKVGELMNRNPITDWPAWRAGFVAEQVAAIAPEGMSPLKRRMLEKKAKKGTLRAAN